MTRLNEIANILNGIVDCGNAEMREMERADLERHWHFVWNASASLEWNLYQFHDRLRLYGSFCRRWEEMHHGSRCVVERVRDVYLMPKIREFTARMGLEGQAPRRDVQDEESPTEVGLE